MKNLTLLFISIIGLIAISSCQKKNENSTTTSNDGISVDSVTYKLETPPKITKDGDTVITSFKVKYPKLVVELNISIMQHRSASQ